MTNPSEAAHALNARYVLPVVGEPIADGVVRVEGERIESVGRLRPGETATDLGDAAILPGLVNAHTHLEFSDLAEPLLPPGGSMGQWILRVVACRRDERRSAEAAVRTGLAESVAAGVTTIGEIATGATWSQLGSPERIVPEVVVFQESIGLTAERFAEPAARAAAHIALPLWRQTHLWPGLSPHAPYTVGKQLLFANVSLAAEHRVPLAIHLAESAEEMELLAHGSGPLVDSLRELGAWDAAAIDVPTRPLDILRRLEGARRVLVIHGGYLDDEEIAFLAARREQFAVVYCPRTHERFGRDADIYQRMAAAGVSLALGTDSRATNPDLSLLSEMRTAARLHPSISAASIVRMGTLAGAKSLGVADELGSLEPGKLANLAVVPLGAGNVGSDPYSHFLRGNQSAIATYWRGRRIA